MLTTKRVIIATICGIVFGFVCLGLALSNPHPEGVITLPIKINIVLSRVLLGFMIGISALRLKWWLHGAVLGLIMSIPMAVQVMDKPQIMIGTFVMGIIYGVLTELITSILFKAKQPINQ